MTEEGMYVGGLTLIRTGNRCECSKLHCEPNLLVFLTRREIARPGGSCLRDNGSEGSVRVSASTVKLRASLTRQTR
jgi:hypothetical protein